MTNDEMISARCAWMMQSPRGDCDDVRREGVFSSSKLPQGNEVMRRSRVMSQSDVI
jgi:hypothetical protein